MKPDEAADKVIDLLREAHREPINEAHFAAVRTRVLSQIAAEQAAPRRRIWPFGLVTAAAAALLLAFWPKQPAPIEKPVAHASALAPSHDREGAVVRARVTTTHTQPLPTAAPARPAHRRPPVMPFIGPPNPQPLVVKLITNDPNVVIYWISERTGE